MAPKMDDATASMVINLEEKTGKPLSEWVALVQSLGPLRHGMTHGYANLVAHSASGVLSEAAPEGDALVDAQYAGETAYVSIRRSKQFAIVQPSTKARVDVGINLKGVPPAGRLEAPKDVDTELTAWLRKAYDGA